MTTGLSATASKLVLTPLYCSMLISSLSPSHRTHYYKIQEHCKSHSVAGWYFVPNFTLRTCGPHRALLNVEKAHWTILIFICIQIENRFALRVRFCLRHCQDSIPISVFDVTVFPLIAALFLLSLSFPFPLVCIRLTELCSDRTRKN